VDAGTMNRVGQEDALRFARGEEITTTHGLRAKLSRPLDFIVVSDHAEMYGLMPQLLSGDPEILATEKGRKWYNELMTGDPDTIFATAMEIVASLQEKTPPINNPEATRKAWHNYAELADQYNDPGQFSAIIGYEWTARIPRICGVHWTSFRSEPEPRYWPSPTTATSATAVCSAWRISTAAA
jgi:hypothetical protein